MPYRMHSPRILAGVGFLLLAYLGAWLILWLAKVDLMAWWPWKWFQGVKPLEPTVRGTAIQAGVAWVGGIIGLGTFFLNRAQKQEHFDRQTFEARFVDIQDRFADKDSVMMRASAAIRLAEIAQTVSPGFNAKRLHEADYPFFPRAAAQLSAALHMEPEQSVRDEVKNALERMVEFSKRGDQRLLYLLLEELKRANQSSVRSVRYAIAVRLPREELTREELLSKLSEGARFCRHIEANQQAWLDLAEGVEGRAGQSVAELDPTSPNPDPNQNVNLRKQSSRLRDTRDALATALRALSSPPDLPKGSSPEDLQLWERSDAFDLEGAFLSGARLTGVMLQGANLRLAQVHGAQLEGAQLQGCDLRSAGLQGADLSNVNLAGATLIGAELQLANLSDAELYGADLRLADMQGAVARGAFMDGASLERAQLQRADISEANLMGVDMVGVCLDDAKAIGTNLHYSDLDGGHLDRINLMAGSLLGSTLRGAHMEEAILLKAKLDGANLSGVTLRNAVLTWANVQGSRFHEANLDGAKLVRLVLETGDPSRPNPANFEYSSWRSANFRINDKILDEETYGWFVNNYGTDEEKRALAPNPQDAIVCIGEAPDEPGMANPELNDTQEPE